MIRIGVDYYPEHWPESGWAADIRRMKDAGVTTVRIAEFAWGLLEPEEGRFNFDWLDRIVAMLGKAGIEIILGTPTNCAPLWLYRSYPETLAVERDGSRTATGLRGHRCIESPLFRKYAARIIGEMTRRYAANPHVAAWQIDNELGENHCCCPVCAAKFRAFCGRSTVRWTRSTTPGAQTYGAARSAIGSRSPRPSARCTATTGITPAICWISTAGRQSPRRITSASRWRSCGGRCRPASPSPPTPASRSTPSTFTRPLPRWTWPATTTTPRRSTPRTRRPSIPRRRLST